ncbi:MAG: hypothetical protein Kow0092_30090 [Deferrisomatales bacterium]
MRPSRIVLLLTAFSLLVGFRNALDGTYQGVGTEAPDTRLVDLEGAPVALSEAVSGWTLLKFGTTWCPRCDDQIRELNRLAGFLHRRHIQVVEVYLRESEEAVRAEQEQLSRTYAPRVLRDPGGDAILLFGLRIIPRLFLVDPGGVVRLDTRYAEAPELKRRIGEVLAPTARRPGG